jgi:hypothetical protein
MRNVVMQSMTAILLLGVVAGCDTATEPTPPGSCSYVTSPAEFTPCMASPDELVLNIATADTCPWSVASSVPWLSAATAIQGTGNGLVRYHISDNWDAPRQGLISVRGSLPNQGPDVRVAQAGCRYWLSQTLMNPPASGGSYVIQVLQQSEPLTCGGPLQNACLWLALADVSWIVVTTPMPRTGDQQLSFTVASNNDDVSARTGTITVRDQILRVTQAGR